MIEIIKAFAILVGGIWLRCCGGIMITMIVFDIYRVFEIMELDRIAKEKKKKQLIRARKMQNSRQSVNRGTKQLRVSR